MATVVITGANRGIGLELCRQCAARGDTVIAVCRSAGNELAALGVEVIDGIDVAEQRDVTALASRLRGREIDILINNAGILRADRLDSADPDAMLAQYRVNAIGPLCVTRALRGRIRNGGKVGIVSSRVGSIADNGSGGNYGYRASKAAANMIGTNLMHDLEPDGISVALLHPGMVATDMTRGNGIAPAEAAAGILARIDELTPESSGGFWHANGERLPW
ncbi:MAG TPA: SDR family oxidoreductase [Woeseiaceae bacterium]|nr:SDR family oxidoreductase [Woeseiaceae bacterium]